MQFHSTISFRQDLFLQFVRLNLFEFTVLLMTTQNQHKITVYHNTVYKTRKVLCLVRIHRTPWSITSKRLILDNLSGRYYNNKSVASAKFWTCDQIMICATNGIRWESGQSGSKCEWVCVKKETIIWTCYGTAQVYSIIDYK